MRVYLRMDLQGVFEPRVFTEKAFIEYVNRYVEIDMGYPDDYKNVVSTIDEAIEWANGDEFDILDLELEE